MSAQRFFLPAAAGATAIGGFLYYNTKQNQNKSRVEQRQERSQAKRDAGLGGAGVGQNAMTGLHEKGGPGSGVPTHNTDPDRKVKTDAPREKLPAGGVGGGVGGGGANSRAIDISAKKSTTDADGGTFGSRDGTSSDVGSTNKSSTGRGNSDGGTFGAGAGSSPDGKSSTNKNSTGGGSSDGGRGSSKSVPSGDSSSPPGTATTNQASSTGSWSQGLQSIFGQGGGSTADPKDNPQRKYSDPKVHSNHADTPTKRFTG